MQPLVGERVEVETPHPRAAVKRIAEKLDGLVPTGRSGSRPPVAVAVLDEPRSVPTIGIGAGRHCDGQVLVYHDILGFEDRVRPKFVRRYGDMRRHVAEAVSAYASDVRDRSFPAEAETYFSKAVKPS